MFKAKTSRTLSSTSRKEKYSAYSIGNRRYGNSPRSSVSTQEARPNGVTKKSSPTKQRRNPPRNGISDFRQITLDLEVSPEFNATYGKNFEATVLETELYQYIFCFGYKEPGGTTKVVSLWDFPLYKKEPFNDREVVLALHKLLSDVDFVVAHNVRFDLGVAKARFIYHHLQPIVFPKSFCTLKWSQRNLHLNSHSLKNVARFFGVKHKMETSKNLWQDIHYRQDPKARAEMVEYNGVDVDVCDEVHDIMARWDTKAEPVKLHALCQNTRCGSDNVQFRGMSRDMKKHIFVCKDCGKWGRVRP